MFEWLFGKKDSHFEEKTQQAFLDVRKDMNVVGKWVKHLDTQDKQLFDSLEEIKRELSSMKDEVASLREGFSLATEAQDYKRVFTQTPVLDKQTADYGVQEGVQTGVQTGDFHIILKGFTSNERLVIFTLAQSDMKLSYEDLALLLGKERATIRGQINSIKQKREGLLCELSEKNGKKRVFIPEELKEKLRKYAKVRVTNPKKARKKELFEEKSESYET